MTTLLFTCFGATPNYNQGLCSSLLSEITSKWGAEDLLQVSYMQDKLPTHDLLSLCMTMKIK